MGDKQKRHEEQRHASDDAKRMRIICAPNSRLDRFMYTIKKGRGLMMCVTLFLYASSTTQKDALYRYGAHAARRCIVIFMRERQRARWWWSIINHVCGTVENTMCVLNIVDARVNTCVALYIDDRGLFAHRAELFNIIDLQMVFRKCLKKYSTISKRLSNT